MGENRVSAIVKNVFYFKVLVNVWVLAVNLVPNAQDAVDAHVTKELKIVGVVNGPQIHILIYWRREAGLGKKPRLALILEFAILVIKIIINAVVVAVLIARDYGRIFWDEIVQLGEQHLVTMQNVWHGALAALHVVQDCILESKAL